MLAADENCKNEVVVMVLKVLTVLVKYGYYDDSADIDDVLPSLHKLMNGKRDYPTEQIKQIMSAGPLSFIRAPSSRQSKSAQDYALISIIGYL